MSSQLQSFKQSYNEAKKKKRDEVTQSPGLQVLAQSQGAARDREALLSLSGDRCVLPLYKLAVGNIVRGRAAIAGKLEVERQ